MNGELYVALLLLLPQLVSLLLGVLALRCRRPWLLGFGGGAGEAIRTALSNGTQRMASSSSGSG